MPSTFLPARERWQRAELPLAPNPTMMTSKAPWVSIDRKIRLISVSMNLEIEHRPAIDATVDESALTRVLVVGHKPIVIDIADAELFPFESERIAFLFTGKTRRKQRIVKGYPVGAKGKIVKPFAGKQGIGACIELFPSVAEPRSKRTQLAVGDILLSGRKGTRI